MLGDSEKDIQMDRILKSLENSLHNLKLANNNYNGILVVVDGLQRSGKSTVLYKLENKLKDSGLEYITTEWNSVPTLKAMTNEKKNKSSFTPLTWFALHYTDFIIRYEDVILPALKRGKIVLCDRYIYTALSRDILKGIESDFLINAFKFAIQPDIVLFFKVDYELAYLRYLEKNRCYVQKYNTGLDIFGPQFDLKTTYIKYNNLLHECYKKMSLAFQIPILNLQYESADNIVENIIQLIYKKMH